MLPDCLVVVDRSRTWNALNSTDFGCVQGVVFPVSSLSNSAVSAASALSSSGSASFTGDGED
jgi:hypothetical protein